ncbi:hypothetical protein ACQ5SO_06250 [Rhodovulum sp. DZ06]|uniref:hypothetical protein n=1 Tax=Rhodovulum sp. DZ06 TaxID=3425126 RepID=UPI003D32F53E
MSAKKGAVVAARKGFAAALNELETVVTRRMIAPAMAQAAPRGGAGMLPGLQMGGAPNGGAAESEGLRDRVAELEAALALAERERDAARAALTALRSARAEEARLVEDALRDLRQVS